MDDTVTYEWSEELSKACQRAFYRDRVGRPVLMVAGGLICCFLGWVAEFCSFYPDMPIGLIFTFFGLILIVAPVRIYIYTRRLARDAVRLIEGDLKVTVTITEESITILSRNATSTTEWKRMTRLKEVDRFLFLFAGKLLVANLPREPFSDEQIVFIRRMMGK